MFTHQAHKKSFRYSPAHMHSSDTLTTWYTPLMHNFNVSRPSVYTRACSTLTHVDGKGKAHMVDVSAKQTTVREACASATVKVGPTIAALIQANNMKKGDVLSIAQIAGILGAKKTADLIPLCHNIVLSTVQVLAELHMDTHSVALQATVRCSGQTGVEMEALTAVSVAALTVYDMCKAVSHDITITDIRLMAKSGGKRDFQRCATK